VLLALEATISKEDPWPVRDGCAILRAMDAEKPFTENLVDWLQKAGLAEITAVMLEAAGPLTILGAQAIFMFEPLVSSPGSRLRELAHALEDKDQVGHLVQRLREQGEST
jgi:hypothetical protein